METEEGMAKPQETMEGESIQKERWYFGKIGRLAAEANLTRHLAVGTFLIRDSDSTPDMYSLSLVKGSASEGFKVSHHKILCVKNKSYWISSTRIFSNLQALVAFYKRNSVDIGNQLTVPCPKEGEEAEVEEVEEEQAEEEQAEKNEIEIDDDTSEHSEAQTESDDEEAENNEGTGSPTFYIVNHDDKTDTNGFAPIKETVEPRNDRRESERPEYVNMNMLEKLPKPSPLRAASALTANQDPSQEDEQQPGLEPVTTVPTENNYVLMTAGETENLVTESTKIPEEPRSPQPVRSQPVAENLSAPVRPIPVTPVKEVAPDTNPATRYASEVANQLWYFGNVGREKAVQLLMACATHGMYLIRDSASSAGCYTLTAYHGDKNDYRVTNYRIEMDGNFCHLGSSGLQFASISGLITYYRNHQLSPKFKLTVPCPKDGPRQKVEATKELEHCSVALDKQIFFGTQHECWQGIWEGIMDASVTIVRKTNKVLSRGWRTHVDMINNLQHRNIACFYGIAKYDARDQLYIVTEWMEKGSLLTCLQQSLFANFLEKICVAEQIANAMLYLQARKIVLRNLQAQHVSVTKNSECKLANFQTAEFLGNGVYQEEGEMKEISTKWSAPEAAIYGKFTTASDVWSYGVLLYEVFTDGKAPYPNMAPLESLLRVKEGYRIPQPAESDCPTHAYELMAECWRENAEVRPTFKALRDKLKNFYTTTKVELVVLKHTFALMS